MLLLAVDTSGRNGSLALARVTQGRSEVDVAEIVPLAGGAFSAQLVPQIIALLEKHGQNSRDLGAFAVASGPGSFTGLRVGLAAIKALAEILQKPIAAVSFLEAVAWSGRLQRAPSRGVLAVLDAGRGDLYVGDYELQPHIHMQSERLLSREEFVAEINRAEAIKKMIITPDPQLAEMVQARRIASEIQVELVEAPNSAVIAQLGWEHLQRGETVRPEDLEANYIRHSDAEIFSKPA
jgi:tRNA threonylcarbamoyladenosine biosynthesis protein TsaB